MISRFIAPPYALEYQKNHCSPFSLMPWELSLHDTNSHFKKCPRPSLTSLYRYRSQTSSYRRQTLQHTLECHAVGIIGILVHDPIHAGSRLLNAGDSFRKYRALSWVATSMALSTISSLPFEIAPIMPLQAALSPCVDNFYLCFSAYRAGRV